MYDDGAILWKPWRLRICTIGVNYFEQFYHHFDVMFILGVLVSVNVSRAVRQKPRTILIAYIRGYMSNVVFWYGWHGATCEHLNRLFFPKKIVPSHMNRFDVNRRHSWLLAQLMASNFRFSSGPKAGCGNNNQTNVAEQHQRSVGNKMFGVYRPGFNNRTVTQINFKASIWRR